MEQKKVVKCLNVGNEIISVFKDKNKDILKVSELPPNKQQNIFNLMKNNTNDNKINEGNIKYVSLKLNENDIISNENSNYIEIYYNNNNNNDVNLESYKSEIISLEHKLSLLTKEYKLLTSKTNNDKYEIELLHKYNEIRDVGLMLLGVLS